MSGAPPHGRQIVHAEFADYDRATGGYVYNARMRTELGVLGWAVSALQLPPGFPQPSDAARDQIAAQFAAIPDGTIVLIDQVCLGPVADLARQHVGRLKWVNIFHHPMVHDLVPGSAKRERVDRIERAGLGLAHRVQATSRTTAETLSSDYHVPAASVIVATPGFERFAPRAPREQTGPMRLLSVGALVPRKGYLTLIESLAGLTSFDWRLRIVGNPDRAPRHAAEIAASARRLGLGDRVAILGKLSDNAIAREWADADLYVSASEHEGFGMAIGEAVGRGLPVITTSAGAVGEWLSPACATILPVGDVRALRDAIAAVLSNPDRLHAMSRAASTAAASLPTWAESACIVSDSLAGL